MKRLILLSSFLSAALLATGCGQKIDVKTDDQKLSYGIGLNIGAGLKKDGLNIDPETLAAGIRDAQSGVKPLVAPEEIAKIMAAKQQEMMTKQTQQAQVLGQKNLADGEAFLAANKTKEGVQTTASGLQYKVLKQGTGKKPTEASSVTVTYTGKLIDGTVFDASEKHGGTATFPLKGVIPGWTEGMQLMSEGASYEFYIPAKLAYGERGAGGAIPPNATLVFEVGLVKIN